MNRWHGRIQQVPHTDDESTDWPPSGYSPSYGTGYKVMFDDFLQLLFYPPYRPTIVPLLQTWFGYEITGEERATAVRSPAGEAVDLRALHERIQADPRMQYALYQRAMDLWR